MYEPLTKPKSIGQYLFVDNANLYDLLSVVINNIMLLNKLRIIIITEIILS